MIRLFAILFLALSGCAHDFYPCNYNGKWITQHEANKLAAQGYEVNCMDENP